MSIFSIGIHQDTMIIETPEGGVDVPRLHYL